MGPNQHSVRIFTHVPPHLISHLPPPTSLLSDPCPCWTPLPPAPLTVTALLSLQVKASAAQEGNADPLAPRWRAVGLLQEQWSGLVEGYQARARAEGSSPATVNGSNTVGSGVRLRGSLLV